MNFEELKKGLKAREGLELKEYICPAGYPTIGYGRNLKSNGISLKEADYLLKNDVEMIDNLLWNELFFYKFLIQPRKNALIEIVYNMGFSNFMEFEKTINYLGLGEWKNASKELLDSEWHRDFIKYDMLDGKKSKSKLRSEILSEMIEKGIYL